MFALEKALSFDILSKLFLISCTLCEVLDLWDIARALSMWPIYGPSMVTILVSLQMVSCFITLVNKILRGALRRQKTTNAPGERLRYI
ncbi:hypothetical protein GJ744_007204 [Endocarpon pusillum]|uniref:Uncharacterized protein n=1 Tax=Endocarpon pusillum TaxID=364733 RepID=A0A8H7E0Q3_9EURO|nr:hypothetical protein GJ744_007204 [Endocarpon pusillum]